MTLQAEDKNLLARFVLEKTCQNKPVLFMNFILLL